MKAVERAKLVRSLRQESRRLRLLVAVILFFLVTLTFVVVSRPDALLFTRTRDATISPFFFLLALSVSSALPCSNPLHGADRSVRRACLVAVNGRLSVDQAPRSLLIRQRVDADDAASRRSAEDPNVVDDEASANPKGERFNFFVNYST
jgi:hypothetical protein